MEIREVVWAASAPATTRAPRVRALRDVEGLRRAMLYAGLAPSAAASPLNLEASGMPPASLVAALHPELAATAAAGGAEAADALDALAAQLAPRLRICVVRATRPAHAAGAR